MQVLARSLWFLALAGLLAWSRPAWSSDGAERHGSAETHDRDDDADSDVLQPLVEELISVETAFVQEQGEIQITSMVEHLDRDGGSQMQVALEFEYGVTSWLQAAVGASVVRIASDAGGDEGPGIGDVELGVLVPVVSRATFLFSLGFESTLPTGDEERGLGGGEFVWQPSARASIRTLGAQWHAALGAEVTGDALAFEYGVAMTRSLASWVVSLEWTGEFDDEEFSASLVPGLFWCGSEPLQIGAGVPVGLAGEAANWGLSAVVLLEF